MRYSAMPKEKLTPLERWTAVLNGEKPDRFPMDYWGTDETTRLLKKHLGCANRWQVYKKLHIDYLYRVKPDYIGPRIPRNYDVFGCRYRIIRYKNGKYREIVSSPLSEFHTVKDIKMNYRWPNPDWWDYSVLRKKLRGKEAYPITGGAFEPFLIYKKLRGEEQAFVDLIQNPDIVHYCLKQLFQLGYEEFVRIYEQIHGSVLLSFVSEDMGAQKGLMFSVDHIRKFLIPNMKKLIDLAHQAGVFVFHHNDGSIREILPDMIALGIDVLNPIQWRCDNMDRLKLKQDFGQKVILHGGVDNQETLPFGTPEEVWNEVSDNLRILGQGGGYILAPCHNIQPITPMENILALYKAGYELGWT